MERLQTAAIQICAFIFICCAVSGCVAIDHAIYKDRHPNDSWGTYFYCRIMRVP